MRHNVRLEEISLILLGTLTNTTLQNLCINHRDQRFINLKSSFMSYLALFEYLCYGSTDIIHFLFFSVRDRLNMVCVLKGLIKKNA